MMDLPASIRGSFLAAGWRPGRRVAVSPAVKTDHPACAILAEFDGLRVGQVGLGGEECGTSDVAFQLLWPDDTIRVWGQLLATQLIGVAEVHHAHEELFVDDHCRFFGASLIHDAFYFHGASFGEAMERLLLGRRAQPMLRPDQDRVTLYGEVFTADHPTIYRYR
jgi:SUKH-3 immunity protein